MAAASTVTSKVLQRLQIHSTIQSFRQARRKILPSLNIGFVPTMGALHNGHLSLLELAKQENDVVVCSIFVNPTQFAPNEDLDKYPRQFERDCELLEDIGGVDHIFAPSIDVMYGSNHVTSVDPGEGFENTPEGKQRPGHFRGVATIVTKLLNIVQPTKAYFGQKDAAQCVLIQRIVSDLNIDVDIVVGETVREEDGLAMSSRNAYLMDNPENRKAAPIIHKSLLQAKMLYLDGMENNGSGVSATLLRDTVIQGLKTEPLIHEIQYVDVSSRQTMQPLEYVDHDGAIISLACKIGSVRLIDNIVL